MFGSWLYGVKKELRSLVLLGAGVIAWSIWLYRNDIVFEKKKIYSPLQVIYAATHRLRSWDILQRSGMQGIAVVVRGSWSRWRRSSFPRHLDGGLVYGLTVISCCFFVSLYAVCLLVWQRPGVFQSLCINSMYCSLV
jgi:4-hydroxybenzoate polyprenyltransferase